MFFIFGSPRSGTTLLAQSLSQHDEVFVPDETDFIIPIAFLFDRVKDPRIGRQLIYETICNSARFDHSIGCYLDRNRITEIVLSVDYDLYTILEAIYTEVALSNGSRIGGDKSPNDISNFYMLAKAGVFEKGAKIIHIVRDPRDVMVSLVKLGWVRDYNANFPRAWANINQNLNDQFKADPQKYFLVKYEDLVAEFRTSMAGISTFLGIEYQEQMSECELRNQRYRQHAHHTNLFNPVSGSRVGVYREEIVDESLAVIQEKAKEGMLAFGYSLLGTT